VPRWLCERSHSFEQITRYSQVDIDSPGNDQRFPAGTPVNVGVRLHPRFNRQHLQRLELRAAPGHDLDFPELVMGQSADPNVQSIVWTPPAPGPWRFRLLLVNSLGEEFSSEPLYLFAEPPGGGPIYQRITGAWLQPRSLRYRDIYNASNRVVYNDPASYRQAVRAIERPMVQPSVDDPANLQVGGSLIDGNLTQAATGPAGLRWYGVKGLVFDLGASRRLDFVELVAPPGSSADYFGKFGVQVATLPDAQYSYTNSDFTWRTVRRMGHARMSAKLPLDIDRSYRIHLPAGTEARYLRFIIHTIDSMGSSDGNLSEVRIGSYPGLARGSDRHARL
ncbi:MAG: discoidin domain-containing protein, partial [Proteobacteria bacterium]|nr:discoidin domain-containing protein [Pseudomonadota bacterium]